MVCNSDSNFAPDPPQLMSNNKTAVWPIPARGWLECGFTNALSFLARLLRKGGIPQSRRAWFSPHQWLGGWPTLFGFKKIEVAPPFAVFERWA